MCSVELGQELDLLTQMLFQPRHDLEQVDVEVPSTRRRPVTAAVTLGCVAHVDGAPAHYSHLVMEAGETPM